MRFYVGLHDPHNAGRFERSMISLNRLRRVRRGVMRERVRDFPVQRWLLDSGAFTEITQHGHHRTSVETYAASIQRWARCGTLEAAAAQDWMCEPFALAKTGLSVAEHQRLTTANYRALCQLVPARLYVMPVLQGYTAEEYVAHVAQYGADLAPGQWVGVGSVCKRNAAPDAVAHILRAIKAARPDLRLHGYGIKITALEQPAVRELLYSADSMAWSYHERKNQRDPNDWRAAVTFVQRIERSRQPMSLPPLYVDNSTAKSLAACSMQAWLQYHLGYQSKAARGPLVAGTCWHVAMRVWLSTWDVEQAVRAFEFGWTAPGETEPSIAYRQWATDNPEALWAGADDRLHPTNLVRILRRYCETHPAEAYPFIVDPKFLEIGFVFELAPGINVVGRADGIVRDRETDHLYVLEHKSTGQLDATWLRQFTMDSQVSCYQAGVQEHVGAERIVGTYINAVEFSKLPSDPKKKCRGVPSRQIEAHGVPYSECGDLHATFRIALATRTEVALDAWRVSMLTQARRYQRLQAAYPTLDYLDMVPQEGTFTYACKNCGFADFCGTGRQRALVDTMLVHDPWSPFQHAFGKQSLDPVAETMAELPAVVNR